MAIGLEDQGQFCPSENGADIWIPKIKYIVDSVSLSDPNEQGDNLLLWAGEQLRPSPGTWIEREGDSVLELAARVGAGTQDDAWFVISQPEQAGLVATNNSMSSIPFALHFRAGSASEN